VREVNEWATTHWGAPGPPGAAWWVVASPATLRCPPSGIWMPLTWKKVGEDFRDEAPPSRGGTWVGALLPSGGQIPPEELPSQRGKPSSSSSPTTLPSWGSNLHQPLQQHHLISNPSSSLVSIFDLKPQIGTCGLLVVWITPCS
jgi:hypothetical protein